MLSEKNVFNRKTKLIVCDERMLYSHYVQIAHFMYIGRHFLADLSKAIPPVSVIEFLCDFLCYSQIAGANKHSQPIKPTDFEHILPPAQMINFALMSLQKCASHVIT